MQKAPGQEPADRVKPPDLRRDTKVFVLLCVLVAALGHVSLGVSDIYTTSVWRDADGTVVGRESHFDPGPLLLVLIAVPIGIWVVTKLARYLRPKGSIARPLAASLVIVTALSFVGAVVFSWQYWGYWPSPPDLDPRVAYARRVIGLGAFQYGSRGGPGPMEFRRELPQPRTGDATEDPVGYTLSQLRDAGWPMTARGTSPLSLKLLLQLPSDPKIRLTSQKGYHSQRALWGLWAEFDGQDGNRYLFLAANGDEISNDHHPHYKLLYRMQDQKLSLVNHQIFFFDLAGIEGATWPRFFHFVLSGLGSWMAVAAALVWLAVKRRRALRDKRTDSMICPSELNT